MMIKFTKMHGLGNDFVIINALSEEIARPSQLAKKVCDRNFGVGADGLVLILASQKKGDYRMRIFNPDGSEPEMCGNAIRCFAKYLYEKGLTDKKKLEVETLAGIIKPELILDKQGVVKLVKVDMGEPILARNSIPMTGKATKEVVKEELIVGDESFTITAVSMGNPHCIIFVDDVEEVAIEKWGPKIEVHDRFPANINVEFVEIITPDRLKMRVWERGAGITLACGTGACASLVAAVLNDLSKRQATVNLLGGDLVIEWRENNHVYMSGPATEVFSGKLDFNF